MAEDMYQNLVAEQDAAAPRSVHLCAYPTVDEDYIDTELEARMKEVLAVTVLGRAARNAASVKNRQPIGKMFVSGAGELSDFYKEIIEDELNVKLVEFSDDVSEFTSYTFKPQMRILGPKYGKKLGMIGKTLASVDGSAAKRQLDTEGVLTIEVDGDKIELTPEELLITMTQKDGYVSQADRGITVVLDTNLTPELIEEGFVREIISKIQTMRKEAGFEVTDHITVSACGNDKIRQIMDKHGEEIKKDVLADDITFDVEKGYSKEWNINKEKVVLCVEKHQ
jgi:isoleucyl-tRNA synthetase